MKNAGFILLAFGLLVAGVVMYGPIKPPIVHGRLSSDAFGEVVMAEPLWGTQGIAVVFVNEHTVKPSELSQRVAELGLTAAVVDSQAFLSQYTDDTEQCLSAEVVAGALNLLLKQLPQSATQRVLIAGMAEGALIPFINALSATNDSISNLSIGFSVKLPNELNVCPPVLAQPQEQNQILVSAPEIQAGWRSVWSDQPDDKTGVFIRSLGNVDTRIAAYDTPIESLLLAEVNAFIGRQAAAAPVLPVVEVPAGRSADTVTLFYSGDGGWRDLDRSVAGEMAAQNFPVIGIDVLRYFWEHKTPEQAAADLSTSMAFYRRQWGVKSFVLAGYSFGADILPPIYNRLPVEDQDSVKLLVLLALADHADFEIHVSGWLGEKGAELALAPELTKIPKQKVLCVYGKEERSETACTELQNSDATALELPGGHHFDQDYPKLTGKILNVYRQHGID